MLTSYTNLNSCNSVCEMSCISNLETHGDLYTTNLTDGVCDLSDDFGNYCSNGLM